MKDDIDVWRLFEKIKGTVHSVDASQLENDIDTICTFCKSVGLILEDGNYVCLTCNSLNERFIDMHAEWRNYSSEDSKSGDPTRCGLPCNDLLPSSSLGSIISNRNNESFDMKLIKKYHMWNSMTYKERSLFSIFDNITVNAINSGIPASIIEEAKVLYKHVSESKISRGENRHGLIASSIYLSCKKSNVPRSSKEIAKIFNIKPATMNRGCKKFQDLVEVKVNSTTAEDFIERFCSKLNITTEIRNLCRYIVHKADELSIVSNNTPPSVCGSAIYLCSILCNLGLSKRDVGLASETSAVTLSKCYKKMYDYRAQLLPKEAIYKYSIK